jgi:hypothetical protein
MTVTDDDGGVGFDTLVVDVTNIIPEVTSLPDISIFSGGSVSAATKFTDVGVLDTHLASVDWGDGRSNDMTVSESGGSGSVTAEQTYLELGIFPVTVTVTDKDEGSQAITFAVTVTRLPVFIDIKPGSDDNPINLKSKGVIPVAIISTPVAGVGFQPYAAQDTNPMTLQFGPAGATIVHDPGHPEDVNGDGLMDLVIHFRTQMSGLEDGSTAAVLLGETADGRFIESFDLVRILESKGDDAPDDLSSDDSDSNNNGKTDKGKGKG